MPAVIRLTTDLPLSPERACQLARDPALFAFVVRPVLRATGLPSADVEAAPGTTFTARLWLGCLVPAWRHQLTIVTLEDREIATNERGGPVKQWDHRLTFEPHPDGDPDACRYSDEVTLDAGLATPLTALLARALFRWRHARWRTLARAIASSSAPAQSRSRAASGVASQRSGTGWAK